MNNSRAAVPQTPLLITRNFPPTMGGVANYLHHAALHLPVRVVLTLGARNAQAYDESLPFPVWRVATCGRLAGYALLWAALPTAIHRTLGAPLLVGDGPYTGLLALASRRPYALICHGTELLTAQHSLMGNLVLRRVLRGAALLAVNSRYTAGLLADLDVPNERVVLARPGVNLHRYYPSHEEGVALRAREGIGGPLLLTVGRLVERKGHDTVLRALPALLAALPGLCYAVVGDGPERARLEALAGALGVAGAVRFVGARPDGELRAWYNAADCFVMASRYVAGEVEGFGIVYGEASACGCPVVASRSGGASEAVIDGATGLLVPPGDPAALSVALRTLLTNLQAARALGVTGTIYARRNLAWEHTLAALRARLAAL